jgi:hypothetical protein
MTTRRISSHPKPYQHGVVALVRTCMRKLHGELKNFGMERIDTVGMSIYTTQIISNDFSYKPLLISNSTTI